LTAKSIALYLEEIIKNLFLHMIKKFVSSWSL